MLRIVSVRRIPVVFKPKFSIQNVDDLPRVHHLYSNLLGRVRPGMCILYTFRDEYVHFVQVGVIT